MTDDLKSILDRIDSAAAETRRHFDTVVERLDSKLNLTLETLSLVDQKIDGTAGRLEAKMDAGFAETQAMIKFSYAELDRRLTSLEGRVNEIEALLTSAGIRK